MYNRFDDLFRSYKRGFDSSYYKNGVDFDYIATVLKKSKDTDEVIYKQYPITLDYSEILEKVRHYCKDDEKTVLDIHELCILSIPEYTKSYSFNCCLPYEYDRSYIRETTEIPSFFMYDIQEKEKYMKFIENIKTEFIIKSLSEYSLKYARNHLTPQEYHDIYSSEEKWKQWEATASKKFSSIDELPIDEYSDKIKKDLENFELKQQKRHKHIYEDVLKFWLQASCYYDTLKHVLEDESVCMYSLENVGWHSYTYPVHDDFEFKVNTNFCYGSSSYFQIIVKYKGIILLPYSHIVSYYHANMVSFLSSTRSFYPERCNWENCFKYVVELINEAYLDENKFIEKWIKQELRIMMERLECIMNDPDDYLENCLQNPLDEQKKDRLITVRNMNEEESNYYKVYRNEMTIAFQAEKITDSIQVIENLKQLSVIIPDVECSIEIIKNLNREAKPIFQNAIISIESDIENRKVELSKYKEELKRVEVSCSEYNEQCKQQWKDSSKQVDYSDFEKDFIRNHTEYEMMLESKLKIKESISILKEDIDQRIVFKDKLKKCTQKIKKFLAE